MTSAAQAVDNRVVLRRLGTYDTEKVDAAITRLLEPLGGMGAFVKPGQRVLIKPNMLAGKAVEQAVTTHPQIVRALIRQAQAAGGDVSVGDSPGIGSPEQVARKTGILDVIEATGARFARFDASRSISTDSGIFQQFEVAEEILDSDVVINVPKLKTHQMMGLTCAVKNMFGAVVGLRKPRLHLQAGTDKAFFALFLLELCEALRPGLTVVDAVVGMEGEGPGSGDPIPIGTLLAGTHPQAVDTAATALVGLRTQQVWTQRKARDTKRPLTDMAALELLGDPFAELKIDNFRPAKMTDVTFGLKGGLKRHLTNALTARPVPDHQRCQLCHACVRHCPPQAMAITGNELRIDYDRCIRCFCCQELCPHGALATRQGLLLKLYGLLSHRG